MSIQIAEVRTVAVPAKRVVATGQPSVLAKAMDALAIGEGFDYVVTGSVGKDGKNAKPTIKNQYAHVSGKKWDAVEKTFKVFLAENREGLGEDQERFTIARVEFTPSKPRAKKAAATEGQNPAENGGEGENA